MTFDPFFELDVTVTSDRVRQAVSDNEYLTGVMLAFRLNELTLICHTSHQLTVGSLVICVVVMIVVVVVVVVVAVAAAAAAEYLTGVMLAFRLNELSLICHAVQHVPPTHSRRLSHCLIITVVIVIVGAPVQCSSW